MIGLVFLCSTRLGAQEGLDTGKKDPTIVYVIQRFDGDVLVGKIVYEDPAMIKFNVKKLGVIVIRKRDIEVIRPMTRHMAQTVGNYIPQEVYASRYVLTSNSLPVKKGENYGDLNLYGPDIHRFFLDNLDVQITSSWVLLPVIANIKYSFKIAHSLYLGGGVMAGWTPWGFSSNSGAIAYGTLTYGNRKSNITLSVGSGEMNTLGLAEQRNMFSLACITKVGLRTSLLFDSFVMPSGASQVSGFAVYLPGLRFQSDPYTAFQFGLGAIVLNGAIQPAPVPFVQWFKRIR